MKWLRRIFWGGVWLALITISLRLLWVEVKGSRYQAIFLADYAARLTYWLEEGENPQIKFPTQGPYNERLGYSDLPKITAGLKSHGYVVTHQARQSPALAQFMEYNGVAVYPEKTASGMRLFDREGGLLFAAKYPQRTYHNYHEIPALVARTLLFIENRELLDPRYPNRNPAIEWDRFAYAVANLGIQKLQPGHKVEGGSTLATQIEKYRHSPGGQTSGPQEKLRQMAAASVRAYVNGPDTTQWRQQILVDYLNSTPLSARAGVGEVNGIGDGLFAWFGTEFDHANRILSESADDHAALHSKARIYKQVLSLLLAQRRPSAYLIDERVSLRELADVYLNLLFTEGVIDRRLRDAALNQSLDFATPETLSSQTDFNAQKATNSLRAKLMTMARIDSLYRLDRNDVDVESTLDTQVQRAVSDVLYSLADPEVLKKYGMLEERLLQAGDPAKVIYSVTLFEKGENANFVRVQADNLNEPLDINEGAKLDLGSTAKLRTLVTWLDIIGQLHQRLATANPTELKKKQLDGPDPLTRWVSHHLLQNPGSSLQDTLNAAIERKFSASPHEAFFTGGGLHRFVNFNKEDDKRMTTVREALRQSINLPFIRLMREVVEYYIIEVQNGTDVRKDPKHPLRQQYLVRFVDQEGSEFLSRFYRLHAGKSQEESLRLLAIRSRPTVNKLAVIFRSTLPDHEFATFAEYVRLHAPKASAKELNDTNLLKLFQKYAPGTFSLADRGYLANLHPLELWLTAYLQNHPSASLSEILKASGKERQDAYLWLFKTRSTAAQNSRIRIQLERDAFVRIHRQWQELGYPFESLIPSYATAIGSSADRPGALAELMGIIANNGIRQPTKRFTRLHFATGTPYETVLGYDDRPPQLMFAPEVAKTLQECLIDVVRNGTAKRVNDVFVDEYGVPVLVGGKTGTGDHRFEKTTSTGVVISSEVVNRTATFAFFLGGRFFGTVTAHVQGAQAADYKFTSALPSQLLKILAPSLHPLFESYGKDRIEGNIQVD